MQNITCLTYFLREDLPTHTAKHVLVTHFPGFKPYDCVKIMSVCVKLDTQPNNVAAGSAAFFQNIIYLSCLLKNT